MDKLVPVIQATPVTTQATPSVSSWYSSEATIGIFNESELAWLQAQGWRVQSAVTENTDTGTRTSYGLTRRIVKPESVLSSLVASYVTAYNEGRQLNDQRYDDLVTLYLSVLDKTEDTFNAQETADATYETLIASIITSVGTDFDTYSADVDGDLDTWGVDLLAEINARFDAELGKARQGLLDRGLYSGTLWASASAGVERERTRGLNSASDTIKQRQLELKHKVYAEQEQMRTRVLAARDRLRTFLSNARDRQVAVRNAAAEILGRLVERREDGYPDLGEITRLAASLGAGSPESYGS